MFWNLQVPWILRFHMFWNLQIPWRNWLKSGCFHVKMHFWISDTLILCTDSEIISLFLKMNFFSLIWYDMYELNSFIIFLFLNSLQRVRMLTQSSTVHSSKSSASAPTITSARCVVKHVHVSSGNIDCCHSNYVEEFINRFCPCGFLHKTTSYLFHSKLFFYYKANVKKM